MSKLIENEPGVVWCKPWGEGQGAYVRVGIKEFDPEKHEIYEAGDNLAPAGKKAAGKKKAD